MKSASGILIGIALNLLMTLDSMNILTVFIFSIQEPMGSWVTESAEHVVFIAVEGGLMREWGEPVKGILGPHRGQPLVHFPNLKLGLLNRGAKQEGVLLNC